MAACADCGKAICMAHYRLSAGVPYCVECFAAKDTAAGDANGTDDSDLELARARQRRDAESSGDDSYDDGDYMVFNPADGQDDLADDSIPPDSFQDS
jgi:hypothetical protein